MVPGLFEPLGHALSSTVFIYGQRGIKRNFVSDLSLTSVKQLLLSVCSLFPPLPTVEVEAPSN